MRRTIRADYPRPGGFRRWLGSKAEWRAAGRDVLFNCGFVAFYALIWLGLSVMGMTALRVLFGYDHSPLWLNYLWAFSNLLWAGLIAMRLWPRHWPL